MSQRDMQNPNPQGSGLETGDVQNMGMHTPGPQQGDVQGMEDSHQTHKLPIATTIGATIGLIGLVLLLYGLFGSANFSRSDGINVDLWWGLVMLVFGILMGLIGIFSARRQAAHVDRGGDTRRTDAMASPSVPKSDGAA